MSLRGPWDQDKQLFWDEGRKERVGERRKGGGEKGRAYERRRVEGEKDRDKQRDKERITMQRRKLQDQKGGKVRRKKKQRRRMMRRKGWSQNDISTESGKAWKKGKKTVKRKHRKECQKLYPWARSCVTEGKKEMTYCTWCSPVGTTQVQMACKLSALRQHNKTQKHHRSAPGRAEGQGDVTKFFRKKKEKRAVKVAEIKLAAFSAVHTSFRYDFKLRIFIIFSP